MANTIHAFHGSPNKFDNFDFAFVGTESGTTGAGFGIYFTELESEAFVYGENCYQCLLVLKNQLHNDKITLTEYQISTLLNNLYEFEEYNHYENYGIQFFPTKSNTDKAFEKVHKEIIRYSNSDTEIIGNIINGGCKIDKMMRVLVSMGFTHTVDNLEPDDQISTHWIVYDINAIIINKVYNLEER